MQNIPGTWHLWQYFLKEYAPEEVDLSKVIPMVLIHDLVEIDAGDTYAYDAVGGATQHTREEAAAQRIYGILPEDQGKWLYDLWEEFKIMKHQRPNMRTCWTTVSHFF